MIRLVRIAAFAICAALSSPLTAQDFDDALDAKLAVDHTTALEIWRPLAEGGDADAQYKLAGLYANAEELLQNDVEAVRWYRLAAEQGVVLAQYYLGLSNAAGQGLPRNLVKAAYWFRRAAE
jgi:TPR repeat protein